MHIKKFFRRDETCFLSFESAKPIKLSFKKQKKIINYSAHYLNQRNILCKCSPKE
jgi:hypothetical protein